jgi:DNA helicase-2/ATP-dependent DNA helicase PcrA
MHTLADDTLLSGLNPSQREAVIHFEGPLLVLAGAGSGKTRVLTSRIARLVGHQGVDPKHILAVTFTNKAAGEMRERIERILGENPSGMWTGTFHAIGARILRSAPHIVGRDRGFTIYDEDDQLNVVKRVMERRSISPKQFTPKAIHAAISSAKNALVSPAEYAKLANDPFTKATSQVYDDLEAAFRAANAVDFDDLLVLPVRMLRESPAFHAELRSKFQFILVDEYQDTNHAQYQLVKMLGSEHQNVCVVGDDDQSIYGWRGADIRNILDFEKDFPNAKVVRLEENYRSTPGILRVANAVISANTERRGKTLRATRAEGDAVTVAGALDDRDEADFVVEEILARRQSNAGMQLRDAAILYRTNSQSRSMEEALRKQALPYRLIGSVRFYDRREIRDLMSYLKLIGNPNDDEAFRRAVSVPRRGLGETTIELLSERARGAGIPLLAAATRADLHEGIRAAARTALGDFARVILSFRERAKTDSVDAILRDLIDAIRYVEHLRAEGPEGEERVENVRELVTGAAEAVIEEGGEVGLTPLEHFLQRASLVAELDKLDPNADAITLMTVHNAKGLEFPVVFVTGLEDGLFPLARAFDDPKMLEEERRLFYVAVTRAEEKLYLTHARSRRRNGETLPSIPSSFLTPLAASLVETKATLRLRATGRTVLPQPPSLRRPGSPLGAWRKPALDMDVEASQDAPRYVKGERVKHARFGGGVIAELAGTGKDTKVTIDFDDESIGRKRLVVAYAGLEREWD